MDGRVLSFWSAAWLLRFVLQLVDAFLTGPVKRAGAASTGSFGSRPPGAVRLMVPRSAATDSPWHGSRSAPQFSWSGWRLTRRAGGLWLTRADESQHGISLVQWQPWRRSAQDITDAAVATVLGIMGLFLVLAAIGHLLVMLAAPAPCSCGHHRSPRRACPTPAGPGSGSRAGSTPRSRYDAIGVGIQRPPASSPAPATPSPLPSHRGARVMLSSRLLRRWPCSRAAFVDPGAIRGRNARRMAARSVQMPAPPRQAGRRARRRHRQRPLRRRGRQPDSPPPCHSAGLSSRSARSGPPPPCRL